MLTSPMTNPGMDPHRTEIRPVTEDDWRLPREVRLSALADSPDAFSSTREREAAFDDSTWRARTGAAAHFIASTSGDAHAVGLAGGRAAPDGATDARELVAMRVAPGSRGEGIAGALVDAVVAWALRQGSEVLRLWAVEGNDAARRAYERAGFVATRERQFVHPDDPRFEMRMARPLRRPPARAKEKCPRPDSNRQPMD